jgi:hypothetical protein
MENLKAKPNILLMALASLAICFKNRVYYIGSIPISINLKIKDSFVYKIISTTCCNKTIIKSKFEDEIAPAIKQFLDC